MTFYVIIKSIYTVKKIKKTNCLKNVCAIIKNFKLSVKVVNLFMTFTIEILFALCEHDTFQTYLVYNSLNQTLITNN